MNLVTAGIRGFHWRTTWCSMVSVLTLRKIVGYGARGLVLAAFGISCVQAQTYNPVVITPPKVDSVDDNYVSILSGKSHFTIPAVKLGDVSFTPISVNGPHFAKSALLDSNYGRIALCQNAAPGPQGFVGTSDCSGASLQAIYGDERADFNYSSGQYTSRALDGSSFVDNGTTCTWTKRDGTQIVYVAYHVAGFPVCSSNNISQIIYPDGRVATYYYYGSFSTAYGTMSPILAITTNSGYLLKYNYSGTPVWGAETSVVAVNRAFQACDPAAVACTLPAGAWPTATVSWQTKLVSVSDDFLLPNANYNPFQHYTFTIATASHTQHVFELDSFFRVISYQPPAATTPVYSYSLCSLLSDAHTLRNCFGITYWYNDAVHSYEQAPLLFDMVNTTTRNTTTQAWTYAENFDPPAPVPGWSTWQHSVCSPLGRCMTARGNSSPGQEIFYGPTDEIDHYDGTVDRFERNTRNYPLTRQTPAGIVSVFGYDLQGNLRGNLWNITRNPVSGSGLSPLTQGSAVYPTSCTNIIICNKPTSVTDANGNTANFSYDPTHGGVLKVTGPAVSTATDSTVNSVHPETRSTYVQRYAWYLSSSGVMTRETHPIWLLATESYCRTTAAATSGSGCAVASDEVAMTYDYGPDSGPNNLILRGKAVSADGQTLRTCYGHDHQVNKIWEASPNANRTSCPDY